MNKSLLLPLILLPLAGCGEDPAPADMDQVSQAPSVQQASTAPAAGEAETVPEDIAAEIEADEIMTEQLSSGDQSGTLETTLEDAQQAIEDAAETTLQKGAEVVDALSAGAEHLMDEKVVPAQQQGEAMFEDAAQQTGEMVDEQITPVLQQGEEMLKGAAESAKQEAGKIMDAIKEQDSPPSSTVTAE